MGQKKMGTRLNKLTNEGWKALKDVIIFGYGRYGSRICQFLKRDFNIVAIVDNDEQKNGQIVDGVPIYSFDSARNLLHNYKIIVTAQAFFYSEISKQLKEEGLKENVDFVIWNQFFPEWFYKYKGTICVAKTDVVITSYCNLRCENCMVFSPYVPKRHETVENIKGSLQAFFDRVDRVQDMNLYGGEPFLHPQLGEIIEEAGKYREKIGYLGIITNGTIIPDTNIIKLLRKYNIGISISDYSFSVDYKTKLNELYRILEEAQINVLCSTNMVWFDLGFPGKRVQIDENILQKHMECCNPVCRDLIDGKIYYCVPDRAAQLGGLIPNSEKSFIDLSKIDKDDLEARKSILEFCTGQIDDGYLELCKKCKGFGEDNFDEIQAAKQISI